MAKSKIVIIHGGHSFDTQADYLQWLQNCDLKLVNSNLDWKNWLRQELEILGYTVYQLKMPNPNNAKYCEWETMFDKLTYDISKNDILIGHSLGGIFLARYLSLNNLKVKSLHLVAAPSQKCGDFELPENIQKVNENVDEIVVYHSTDDFVVPFADSEKYLTELPNSKLIQFEDKNHFLQSEFPQLLDILLS